MLFHAPEFISWFLPGVVLVFFVLGVLKAIRLAMLWLILASFFFYGWWRVDYVPLLLASIIANYALGQKLAADRNWVVLALGVTGNLSLLGYFKYTGFILSNINEAFGSDFVSLSVLLPLGISFWTFQQIAFLIDAYDGEVGENDFLSYCLFVSFFPQLIAGPIVHHKEILPQFRRKDTFIPKINYIIFGFTVFTLGLFKKVVIADGIALYADRAFDAAAGGRLLTIAEAWAGAIFFTLEVYFDFSGYADMAMGIGLIFGIVLPLNFDSPFKATSIIEFWSRWHMTLTRFLTAYIYNPLALNLARRRIMSGKAIFKLNSPKPGPFLVLLAIPTITTMFLAGIWHGAGWQFIIFGVLHGAFLTINHAWRAARHYIGLSAGGRLALPSTVLTLLCVIFAMVFFRSESVPHAVNIVGSMVGVNGFVLPDNFRSIFGWAKEIFGEHLSFRESVIFTYDIVYWVPFLIFVTWFCPNTQEWMGILVHRRAREETGVHHPNADGKFRLWSRFLRLRDYRTWQPNLAYGVIIGTILYLAISQVISKAPNRFIYFDF